MLLKLLNFLGFSTGLFLDTMLFSLKENMLSCKVPTLYPLYFLTANNDRSSDDDDDDHGDHDDGEEKEQEAINNNLVSGPSYKTYPTIALKVKDSCLIFYLLISK